MSAVAPLKSEPVAAKAEPILSLNNVEVVYDRVILVLKGVSLAVPSGGIVALLGANGAGKTTTLKAISNLLHSERGEVTKGAIRFDGAEVQKLSPNEVVRRGCIQVMQGRFCFGHLTIEENSAHRRLYPPRRGGGNTRRTRKGLYLFPPAARAAAIIGRVYVGRRAADVRDRPRADVASEDDPARRAIDGFGAADRGGNLHDHEESR